MIWTIPLVLNKMSYSGTFDNYTLMQLCALQG